MKKLFSVILTASILLTAGVFPVSADSNRIRYTEKMIDAYLFDETEPQKLACLFRADLPDVPYISADDFLDQLFTEKVKLTDNGGGIYTVTNDGYDMVIDTEKDTVHFDQAEDFLSANAKPYLDEESADYLKEDEEFTLIGKNQGADLDLGSYDIDITASHGKVYFPYCTLNDMFADNYRQVLYKNGELRFVESMDEEVLYGEYTNNDVKRDKAFADFTYHEFCFAIDNYYGRPSKALIAESIEEHGLDKTLDTYNTTTARIKELLRSESVNDFSVGLMILDCYFYDGGHTTLSYGHMGEGLSDVSDMIVSLFTDFRDIDIETITETQQIGITNALNTQTLKSEKESAYKDFNLVNMWDCAEVYETGSTVIFDFDEFTDRVVEPFKWSLDYADDHNAETFIIDLSTNSGGSTAVAAYMLSIMCGDFKQREICELTGNILEAGVTVDKNLDGEFDKKDENVEYDFNYAILTSNTSFSCADMMPCMAQDNGIAIIGETSGGGCCNIAPHFFPDGGMYTISGISKLIHPDGEDYDSGAKPDHEMPGKDKEYKGFYDINTINTAVGSFYNGTSTPTDATEATEKTASVNDSQETRRPSNESGGNMIYLWIAIAAIVVIILLASVIIVKAGRKTKGMPDQTYRPAKLNDDE